MNRHHRAISLPLSGSVALLIAACHQPAAVSNDATADRANTILPASAVPTAAPTAIAAGPDILTTVARDDKPLTRVAARQGTFAIEKLGDADTLTLNGKATMFKEDGADAPAPVEANNSIELVGVFELPQESIAYVLIYGGTACPVTHVLVGARSGLALPGQSVPGCAESGTMRKNGDKITFEAGGSTGSYQNGVITVTDKPAGYGLQASGTGDALRQP